MRSVFKAFDWAVKANLIQKIYSKYSCVAVGNIIVDNIIYLYRERIFRMTFFKTIFWMKNNNTTISFFHSFFLLNLC